MNNEKRISESLANNQDYHLLNNQLAIYYDEIKRQITDKDLIDKYNQVQKEIDCILLNALIN